MVKTLLNRLGKSVAKGACLVAAMASIGLASCKLPGPDPVPDPPTPKVLELYANPNPVIKGSQTGITLKGIGDKYTLGEDKNGNNQIDTGEVITSSNAPIINYNVKYDAVGNHKLIGQVTNSQGSDTKSIDVIVSDSTFQNIISGTFGDDENKGIKYGMVKAYGDNKKLLQTTLTDPNTGNFIVTIDPATTSNVILQAVSGTDVNPTSYLRTVTIPNATSSGNAIVVVPFEPGWTSQDKDNFITQMGRLNFWSDAERIAAGISGGVTGNPYNGLKKWNHGELPDDINHPIFRGIEVSSHDFPDGNGPGTYYDQIKTIIQSSSCPNAKNINVVYGESYDGVGGWGRIVLGNVSNSPGTTIYDQRGLSQNGLPDGYIERFITYLIPPAQISYNIIRHEGLGHGLHFPGHADGPSVLLPVPLNPLALFNLIMRYTGSDSRYQYTFGTTAPEDFTSTDNKGSYIIDGPTYKGMESENNILGKYFLDNPNPIYN